MAFRWTSWGSCWWRRTLLALLPMMLVLAGPGAAQAQSSGSEWKVPAQYWLDPSGTAPLEAARAAFDAGSGRTANQDQVMPLAHGAAVWYRLQLPPVAVPMLAVFEVPFAGMDKVDLFRPDDVGGWSVQRSGDSLPVNAWAQPYLHPAFNLTLRPQEAQPTFLRVQHSQDIRVRWTLRDMSSFSTVSELWHMALGAYAGFMLLVVMLSVIQTATWRDSIHLYYAVHVVLIGLSVLSIAGLAGEYLWPDQPWWNDKAPLVLPALALGWMGLFVRELVAERGQRWVSWVLLVNVGAGLVMALSFLLNGRSAFYPVPSVYTIPSVILILAVLGWYALRRPLVGVWVFAGWTALAIGSMLPMLRNLGVLPVSFFTQYGLQMGAALEIPLVLAGLFLRSRERRDNMVRLGALARTDPLTGVANHRVLANRLDELLRRARRDPQVGAVLRVHVVNLEIIRADYGREAAEAALLQATECVVREASEGDTVARERSGDLVLLLDGKVSHRHVADAGRNIIARGLKFSGRLPPNVTLSLRVAAFCAPLPNGDAAAVLARLERTLQEMGKERPPRALRVLAGAAPPEPEFDAIDSIAEPE